MVRIRVRRENFMGADCSTGRRLGIGWGGIARSRKLSQRLGGEWVGMGGVESKPAPFKCEPFGDTTSG